MSQLSAYSSVGSTPKAPLDPGTVAFVKGKPAITQPAKNVHYYRQRIVALVGELEHNALEYRQTVAEFKSSGVWKSEFKTWGRTCRECLGISPQRGNELIRELTESYEQDNVEIGKPLSDTDKVETLDTLNNLPDIRSELEAQIAKPAVHAGPVAEPEPEVAPAPKPPGPICDLIGFPIPAALIERWSKRQEVQDRITAASRLRCTLEEIVNRGHQNPLYGAYDWQGLIRTISQLQWHLGQCKPEVVCYECDGDFLKLKASKGGDGITRHCHGCNDRGFLTRKQWDEYADTTLEAVQKRVKARLAKCKEGLKP